ncbi:hypothetical protein GCM10007388_25260 [Pseudoduganella plicata]|uniref:histidine kinase n=2 Tax=Pseudoduganella plicata TaxID=321984 RepID=A0AA87YCH3_9BURK|nr:hypothetical protein GCM10007388_25260 [Pseudoduganella plicata]
MTTYEGAARSAQAFLLGSVTVKREDFSLFVASLRLQEKFPGIQGIALVELVPPQRMADHVASMRRHGFTDYKITPAGERQVYSSITQIEPFTGLNLRALGFDMLSEPTRRAAMERARDTGLAAASGKVRLIQENGKDVQSGLVMYLPVYQRGMQTATVAQRRDSLIGWIGAPFRMNDLMAGLGGERSGDVTLSIYDGTAVSEEARSYSTQLTGLSRVSPPRFRTLQNISVAGRPWTLDIQSSQAFEQRLATDRPQLIAIIGSALSIMISLLVWLLASGRRRALSLATQMTHQLSESEFRWKYALEGAGDGVWDWHISTGEVIYSEQWKTMLGYQDKEIGNSFSEWERRLHPEDKAATDALVRSYLESTAGFLQAEFRMRCKDGSWKWIMTRATAVSRDANGKPLRIIGTHTDISRSKNDEWALREANAQLRDERHRVEVILEHSHDAFIAVLPNGRIRDWNAKAEQLFGWAADEAIGQDLATMIIPEQFRSRHNAGFTRFVETRKAAGNVVEVEALHRTGRWVSVELAFAGVPEGSDYVVTAFIRDISERKTAQLRDAERSEALEEARNALHHAQKLEAIGKLTGGVAHDFNNVLQVVTGNLALLQMHVRDNAGMQKRLDSMKGAVQRGAKLSSQLLAFARRQPLQPVAVNVERLLRNMEELLQRALGETVALTIFCEGELWNTQVDPGQFENLILNLAINARDAMPAGGELSISMKNVTLDENEARKLLGIVESDYIFISIADTGAGMSPEVLAQAFEPFFTTKPVGQGTGLGLSMAYGMVKQSSGHIEISSELGIGTTVMIYLPRTHQLANSAPPPVVASGAGGTETILVVEDDEEVRLSVVANLSELGYRVLHAADGESGLQILKDGPRIDLLFTDVVMPGSVTGPELAVQAKLVQPNLAILFTSGYTRDALTTDGRLQEGVQLLSKPYDQKQLAQRVRQVLAA